MERNGKETTFYEAAKRPKEKEKSRFATFLKEYKKHSSPPNPRQQKAAKKTANQNVAQWWSQPKKRNSLRCKASDPCNHTLKAPQPRARIQSSPACLMIDRPKIQSDSRFTEAAKELSDEELAFLYEDVLKPLDFYAVLHTL